MANIRKRYIVDLIDKAQKFSPLSVSPSPSLLPSRSLLEKIISWGSGSQFFKSIYK
jgi:hypothetical protein